MSEVLFKTSREDRDDRKFLIFIGNTEVWMSAAEASEELVNNPAANIGGDVMSLSGGSTWEIGPHELQELTGGVELTLSDVSDSDLELLLNGDGLG